MSMESSLASSFFRDPECFRRGVWSVLFGEDIQFRRQERRLSMEEAAERAGLSVEEWQARFPSPGNNCAWSGRASERNG